MITSLRIHSIFRHGWNPHPTLYFFKTHSNIILSSTPRFPRWYLTLRFSDYKFLWISHLPFMLHDTPISSGALTVWIILTGTFIIVYIVALLDHVWNTVKKHKSLCNNLSNMSSVSRYRNLGLTARIISNSATNVTYFYNLKKFPFPWHQLIPKFYSIQKFNERIWGIFFPFELYTNIHLSV